MPQSSKTEFSSKIKQLVFPVGLTEATVCKISEIKNEPAWLLQYRLKAFKKWQTMTVPNWGQLKLPAIDFQKISYFASHKYANFNPFTGSKNLDSLDELDPEIKATFDKLGISLNEQKRLTGVAIDVVLDSESVVTTLKTDLAKLGIIFCSISEAVQLYPELVKTYLGSVVPFTDNYFACLNSAVFSDGSFVYIPKNTQCPIDLSTYFRINAPETGQFERTLIIVEDGGQVNYLEGCTAPRRSINQVHAAVVELVAKTGAEINYSTVQNWYPGDKNGQGGILNLVTKRGLAEGKNSKISWTQIETGSAVTWKYPSVILKGENSSGQFYSVAITGNKQQADTGTKMIHIGKNSKSTIISKSVAAGKSSNTYRGLVKFAANATGAKNFTRCDALISNDGASSVNLPTIENNCPEAEVEHEAFTGYLSKQAQLYLNARGLNEKQAWQLQVFGFTKEILGKLPLEFAVEAKNLIKTVF